MNQFATMIRWTLMATALFGAMVWASQLDIQRSPPMPPPPSPEQLAREITYLTQHYPGDRCIHQLKEAAPEADLPEDVAPPDQDRASPYYFVTFDASHLISDGFDDMLIIHKVTRQAYIVRSGGITGSSITRGPMPLDICLQPAFKATALNP